MRPLIRWIFRLDVVVGLLIAVTLCTATDLHAMQARTPSPHDFTRVDTLIREAIAARRLPGAVVVVGHDGRIAYEQAYGDRKLAGEPGLDGVPSAREPMTTDTIFDMASLTKCLATATAIMQLYDAHKIASFDDPVEKYLPQYNPAHDATRAKVSLRMLLTHISGEPPDVGMTDPWGLAAPDKQEGFRRAHTAPLAAAPGLHFEYSDINYILLGEVVERLSGQTLASYAREHIFLPLGMTQTRYLPQDKVCGTYKLVGAAVMSAPAQPGRAPVACRGDEWNASLLARIAPTTHDDEGNASTNPHFDLLTRGTVHDPSARRMGGVAGHAGVFATATDVASYAQALLDKLRHGTGKFPVSQAALKSMIAPEQPASVQDDTILTRDPDSAKPALRTMQGTPVRGFGWDINTAFSRPRGAIFATRAPAMPSAVPASFGHSGFTGTSLWIDPGSDSYVVLLASSVHPRGAPPITTLRGEVATAAAEALGLSPSVVAAGKVRTGIDVLAAENFSALAGFRRIALLTNHTGIDAQGKRTIDRLLQAHQPLVTIFTPEHGLAGKQDTTEMVAEKDDATGIPVVSLYGASDAERRPQHEQLKDLDAVVIDLQDAGVRFWTYESAMHYFLQAAAKERDEFHHSLAIVVLDRPNLIGGVGIGGPVSDLQPGGPVKPSYIDSIALPIRHGMTLGELARYMNAHGKLDVALAVVPMQNWSRSLYFDQTGLAWIDPSPNLRNITAATVYPGLGLFDATNISVGRGSPMPFELFGAGAPAKESGNRTATGGLGADSSPGVTSAWFHASDVAAALNARRIPGVSFAATTTQIAEDANRYPYHGQTIEAVRLIVTDRAALDSPAMGVEILSVLHRLYPKQFTLSRTLDLLGDKATLDAIERGDDPRAIAQSWQSRLDAFEAERAKALLY
ncbi:MAG: DUF1343 domain-containing protein [Rudaea sp.]|uniref:exo-beta-N-acetylmuramidase NamZ domain-containing protein n=1 Tax=Rudaea sp. TaxID=2136325 RepID=UPI0039E4CC9D